VPLPPTKKMNGREECEMLEKMLPVFRFKSRNGPAIQVQTLNKLDSDKFPLAVNNITRENSRSAWGQLKHSKT